RRTGDQATSLTAATTRDETAYARSLLFALGGDADHLDVADLHNGLITSNQLAGIASKISRRARQHDGKLGPEGVPRRTNAHPRHPAHRPLLALNHVIEVVRRHRDVVARLLDIPNQVVVRIATAGPTLNAIAPVDVAEITEHERVALVHEVARLVHHLQFHHLVFKLPKRGS